MKNIYLLLFVIMTISSSVKESNATSIKFISTKAGLNLRSGPDQSSKILTLIPFGKDVSIIKYEKKELFINGRYGNWVNIRYKNKTGYVFSAYLCDFKPEDAIKFIADNYKESVKAVEIVDIIDNYVNFNIPNAGLGPEDMTRRNVIWEYDTSLNQFKEIYKAGDGNSTYMLYLNEDRYIDLVVEDGCCGGIDLHVLVGSINGFNEIYHKDDVCDNWENCFKLNIGKCEKLGFSCIYRNREKNRKENEKDVMNHFKFNCLSNQIEKYATQEVVESKGVITSIDLKSNSFVIKTSENENMYFFYDETFNIGMDKRYIKELQVGKTLTFWYVNINNKRIIIKTFGL